MLERLAESCIDVVPDVYESGYNLWKGGIDLAGYVYFHYSSDGTFVTDASVL